MRTAERSSAMVTLQPLYWFQLKSYSSPLSPAGKNEIYKRMGRLKEDTPDSILSLLPETRGYLTYSSISLFQPRRRKTPHTPWRRVLAIHNALPIAR